MERAAEPAHLLRSLADTPARIESVAGRLSAPRLQTSPAPEAWSPNRILWHIRATADVYGEQIDRILNEDAPRWRHVSPRARMKQVAYDQLPFAESFAAFKLQRSELLATLASIAPEAWQRFALVRAGGRESPLTLQQRLRGMASHEEIHCAEIEGIAAS